MKKTFTLVLATLFVATLTISPLFGQNFTSRATIDQNFCGSSVLVVMQRGVDGMTLFSAESEPTTAVATASAVSGIALQYVQDLTYIPRDPYGIRHVPKLLNEETFKQIVLLRTEDYGKQNVLDLIEQLRFMPGVYFAEPNYLFAIERLPNDLRFGEQWGMQSIQAPQAWGITTGSRTIKVGVIDIGFQAHSDLNANFVDGWCFNSSQVLTLSNLGNTLPHPAAQIGWHGNHVAGIIGAVGGNGMGVAGVAWEVSLVPFEVFSGFSGSTPVGRNDWQVAAVHRAIADNIPVINMSMGGGDTQSMRSVLQNNYRGLFVWAAGNAQTNLDNEISSNIANRLAVGAHDVNNARASFSCFGARTVEIWAPGTAILSTVLNNLFQNAQGTSMAAPHVAGVAALLLSINPDLTGAQLKDLILEGALPITIDQPTATPGQHQSLRLSAAGALEALGAGIPFAPIFQDFEETAGNALPNYWQHSGQTTAWRTTGNIIPGVTGTEGFLADTEPRSGDRQMTRTFHNIGDYAWAFSEPVMLSAGTTYVVSFWYKAPGFSLIGAWDNFRVQIGQTRTLTGTGLNAQMQGATTILTNQNRRVANWSQASIQFTPTSTGPHFIGFQCRTSTGGFLITIDDVSITPIRNIVLSETGIHAFPRAFVGYEPQTPRSVTIENIQNVPTGELTIALRGADSTSFTLSTTTIPSIAGAGTANFTVVPNPGLGLGTYTTTVTVTGDGNTFASFVVSFTVGSETTNIVTVETGDVPSLQVFPNPVTDQLHIVIPSETRGLVEIFDTNGRRVFTHPICQLSMVDGQLSIDISHLPNGMYIVRIGDSTVRIIKQ